jgi:CRP/FNR family transcriptional regulator, cyclic AMP receptor protein
MATAHYDYRHELLSRHFVFGLLAPKEIDAILKLSKERRFTDGQIIFHKGDPGSSLMAVLRGRVRISSCSEEGKEIILSIIEPGQIFGEIALLDRNERSADASAIGECAVLVIDQREFTAFLERNPEVASRLLFMLCQRLRGANEMIEEAAFLDLPGRLARLLLKLAKTYGRDTTDGLRIALKLSQKDLGNLIGASRESVNKQLRAWQEGGLIATREAYITLLRPQQLEVLGQERH